MSALCFEERERERILSSCSAVLKACPGSSWCQTWPMGTQERCPLLAAFLGISCASSLPRVEGQPPKKGGAHSQVDILYIVHFFFLNWEKECLHQNDPSPWEVSC